MSCLLSLRFTLFVKLYDPIELSINTIIEQIKLSKLKQNHFFPFLCISYTSLKSPHFAFNVITFDNEKAKRWRIVQMMGVEV